jgi:hypothetical protein
METLKNQISNQAYQMLYHRKRPKRVSLGLHEQAILDAQPQKPYVIDPQTGTQSFMGLQIVNVDLPTCADVAG